MSEQGARKNSECQGRIIGRLWREANPRRRQRKSNCDEKREYRDPAAALRPRQESRSERQPLMGFFDRKKVVQARMREREKDCRKPERGGKRGVHPDA
jgi:hypothetical protein